MSAVQIQGNASGTGTLTIAAPNTNTNRTLTLPDGTGTFTVAGVNSNIVSGTAVASTSGTSIDFTSIPTWVKRITVMFNSVSTSGNSVLCLQVGSGSVSTSGYASQYWSSVGSGIFTTALGLGATVTTANSFSGLFTLALIGSNTFIFSGLITFDNATSIGYQSAGKTPALGGALDRVRITTIGGTDTFDNGSINILYE